MKRKTIQRLLQIVCLLVFVLGQTAIQAEGASSHHPMICAVCTVDGNGGISIEQAFAGVPVLYEGEYSVLVSKDNYLGNSYYYVGGVGGDDARDLFMMEHEKEYTDFSLFRAEKGVDSRFFYTKFEAPEVDRKYTLVALDTSGELVEKTVSVTKVASKKNSDGLYDISVPDASFGGIVAPAAIVSGERLVALVSNKGIYAFLPASDSGAQKPTEAPTAAPTEAPTAAPTEAPAEAVKAANAGDGENTPHRERKADFPWKTAAVIAGGAVVLLCLMAAFLTKRKKRKMEQKQQEAGEKDVFTPTMPVESPHPAAPLPAAQEYYLQAIGGTLDGMQFPVPEGGLLIGRAMEADVRYLAETKGVSRKHCRVFRRGDSLCVMDLGSTSGTYLSNQGEITANIPVPLEEGVIIYLGSKQIGLRVCSRRKGGN